MKEHFFNCPYCSAQISMIIELSAGDQTYIEDCEVCCQPIQISFRIEDHHLNDFEAKALEE